MLEDEPELKNKAIQLVDTMVAANIAQRKFYTDHRDAKEYPVLTTPNAFDKNLIVIAVLGYPEQAGIWSYTLLRQNRIDESTMEPYFKEFAQNNFGLVAINPNFFVPDIEGDSFIYQLESTIADITPDHKIGFIGFSMGGRILVEYLQHRPDLLLRLAGLVLIDPTLPNRLELSNIRSLLDNNTLLIASHGADPSPGDIAEALLQIPKHQIKGIHGQMPNKALNKIIDFYKKQTGIEDPGVSR